MAGNFQLNGVQYTMAQTDVQVLQKYYDEVVADRGRRLPLPADPRFPETVRLANRIDGNHWPASETVPSAQDRATFERLRQKSPETAEIVVRTLTVFLGADEIALDGLGEMQDVRKKEVEDSIKRRANQEVTHSQVYSNLAQCILDPATYERARALDAEHPALVHLRAWMRKEIVGQPAYKQQLALGVFEVVTFSALFVVPHALKKTGVCPTLSDANALISRDESDHMDAAAAMMQESFGTAPPEVRAAAAREVCRALQEGCAAVDPMLRWVFETGKVVDVGYAEAQKWTHYVCNRFMQKFNRLGQFSDCSGAVFPAAAKCPLPWMEMLSVTNTRVNFFEVLVGTYDKMASAQTMRLPSSAEMAEWEAVDGGATKTALRFSDRTLAEVRRLTGEPRSPRRTPTAAV